MVRILNSHLVIEINIWHMKHSWNKGLKNSTYVFTRSRREQAKLRLSFDSYILDRTLYHHYLAVSVYSRAPFTKID